MSRVALVHVSSCWSVYSYVTWLMRGTGGACSTNQDACPHVATPPAAHLPLPHAGGTLGDRLGRRLPNSPHGRVLVNQFSVLIGMPLSFVLLKGEPIVAGRHAGWVGTASHAHEANDARLLNPRSLIPQRMLAHARCLQACHPVATWGPTMGCLAQCSSCLGCPSGER